LESREYYDFDGWCVDPQECDSGINNIDPTWARDINLYAKWTPKTYPVSYTCGKINIGGEEDYLPNLPNEDNSQESTTVGNVTYGEYYNLDNILPQVLQESSGKIGKCLAIPGFEFEWDCPCRNYQKPEDDDEGGISGGGGAGGGSSSSDEQLSLIWDEHGASCVGKWTAKPYNITYDLNGSVLAPATNNPNNPDVYDANTNIDLLPPTREHYTFNGWFDNQTKIEKLALQPLTWEYVYTQLLNHPDEIARYASTLGPKTLRAEWTADTYPIKYYRDGEEIDNLTPNIHTFGNETSLPASAPKAHYNFVGWYDNNEFNGNQISAISAGEYRNSGEHFTFYGKWTPENYDIYFKDLVKGQYVDVFSSQKYTYDAGTEITDKIPTKNHFEFVGWCNNPELTGNCPMTINISSTDYGNKTYYAKWRRTSCNDGYTQIGWNTDTNEPVCEANTYDIIYHFANGVNLDTYTVDTPKTLWSLTATGIGNEFSGWCENENGCEQPIKCVWCATNPDPNWVGDKDLYPQFGVAEYTIKYYDGTTLIKEDRYHYGDNVTLVAEGKAGYEFDGWYNNVALNGVPVLEIASNEYGNKVFYGKWNKIVIPTEECSGRWLHINNDKACLSSTKITNPSMAFGFDDKTYYLQMTENPDTKFNSKSNKKLRVRHGNTIYNIHDASVNSD